MNKLLLVVTSLVSLVTAGVLDVRIFQDQDVKHHDSYYIQDISQVDLQRQKFLLDILENVHSPPSNEQIYALSKELIIEVQHYIGGVDDDMLYVFQLATQKRILSHTDTYTIVNVDHVRQLRGIYRIFVRSSDWYTLQRNIAYVRVNVNPVLFVNALYSAIRYRTDTQSLILPAIEEILPEYYFDENLVKKVKFFDYNQLSDDVKTIRPHLLDLIGLSKRVNTSSPYYRVGIFGVLHNPLVWKQWREVHNGHSSDVSVRGENKVVFPVGDHFDGINRLLSFTGDIGLTTFTQVLINNLCLLENDYIPRGDDGNNQYINNVEFQDLDKRIEFKDRNSEKYLDPYEYDLEYGRPKTYADEKYQDGNKDNLYENYRLRKYNYDSLNSKQSQSSIDESRGKQKNKSVIRETYDSSENGNDRLLHINRRRVSDHNEKQDEYQYTGNKRNLFDNIVFSSPVSDVRSNIDLQSDEKYNQDFPIDTQTQYGNKRQENYIYPQKNINDKGLLYVNRRRINKYGVENVERERYGYDYTENHLNYEGQYNDKVNEQVTQRAGRDKRMYPDHDETTKEYEVPDYKYKYGNKYYELTDRTNKKQRGKIEFDELYRPTYSYEQDDHQKFAIYEKNKERKGIRSRRSLVASKDNVKKYYRHREVIIHNLQQLVAHINFERLAFNQQEIPNSYISSQYSSNSHYERPIITKINEIIYHLDSVIKKSLNQLKVRDQDLIQSEKTFSAIVGDVLVGRTGNIGILDILRELSTYQKGDKYVKSITGIGFSLTDPAIQYLLHQIVRSIEQYRQEHLKPYKLDNLIFEGVKVNNVYVDKLITYFDESDTDLINLLRTNLEEQNEQSAQKMVVARQRRLNHKNFKIVYDINSDRNQRVVVRTLLRTKISYSNLDDGRQDFIVLDAVITDLRAGQNQIIRYSRDITYTTRDTTPYSEIYKQILLAINGRANTKLPFERHEIIGHTCGYPQRLLLPKGRTEGLPLQLFVIVTPVDVEDVAIEQYVNYNQVCGIGVNSLALDHLPLGFPLDREITNEDYITNLLNVKLQDVIIYHEN